MKADIAKKYFGVADVAVFAVTLVLAALIGIYYAYTDRKKGTLKNYYYGGNKISPIPVGISMAVSYISAITVMSFPADTYMYGLVICWYCFTTVLPTVIASLYFIPLYHRLQLVTIYQLLENRFQPFVRKFCSGIEIINQILYMGFTIYLPSLALNAVTPLQLIWTIALTGGICTFYTAFGGIKAVVWTDVLQSAFMFIGVMAVLIKGTIDVGGFGRVWEALDENGGLNVFNFDFDPRLRTTFWTIIIGFGCTQTYGVCTNQTMIQRYLSCKSVNAARKAAFIAIIPKIVISLSCVVGGAAAYAYFEGCDLIKEGILDKSDQIMPYFALLLFRGLPGLVGFYVAAVYSGTLSTVSSGINSLAALVLEDFTLFIKPNMSIRCRLLFSKFTVAVFGVVVTGIAYLASVLGGSVIKMVLIFRGACGAPILGVFIMATFCPWVNTKGVLTGQILGTALTIWLGVGNYWYGMSPEFVNKLPTSNHQCNVVTPSANSTSSEASVFTNYLTTPTEYKSEKFYPAFYSLSFMYYSVLGLMTTVTFGLLVSFATGANDPRKSDPKYFTPLIDNQRLPQSVRTFFRFGVPELEENLQIQMTKLENVPLSYNIDSDKKMLRD